MTWWWQVIHYSSHTRVPSPSYIHRQTLKRVTVCIFGLVTPPFSQHHMCVLGCLFITFVSPPPPHPIAFLTKETHTHTHTHIYICVCVYIYIYTHTHTHIHTHRHLHTKTQHMSNVTFTSKCTGICLWPRALFPYYTGLKNQDDNGSVPNYNDTSNTLKKY